MTERKLRLEFEYSARNYNNGMADVYELKIKPAGEIKGFFPGEMEFTSTAVARLPMETSLSVAAGQFKMAVASILAERGEEVSFEEKASFKDEQGNEIRVEPATFEF